MTIKWCLESSIHDSMLVYWILYNSKLLAVRNILWPVNRKISTWDNFFLQEIVIVLIIREEMALKVPAVLDALEIQVLNVENMVGSVLMELDCRWPTSWSEDNFYCIREKTPIDGGLSEWTEWSKCSTNCNKERTRQCDNPYAMFGGVDCVGHLQEETEGHSCFFEDCCPGFPKDVHLIKPWTLEI